jgi:MFS family permease
MLLPSRLWHISDHLQSKIRLIRHSPILFARILILDDSMISVCCFEIGSLFCAVAPSVNFLIVGRAVAGVGAAGSKFTSTTLLSRRWHIDSSSVFVSILSIIGEITRLEDRPKLLWYVSDSRRINVGFDGVVFKILWCRVWIFECTRSSAWRCLHR